MPPMSGCTTRSSTSPPKRRRTNAPRLSSPVARERGSTRSNAQRILPVHEKSEVVTMGQRRVGAIIRNPSGNGCSLPRWTTWDLRWVVAVAMIRSATPKRSASRVNQGLEDRKESGPSSTRHPPSSTVRIVPPNRSERSRSVTSRPVRFVSASRCAALNPAMPPPTTTTFIERFPVHARRPRAR